MVNVFIVHSGNDYDYVKTQIEPFLMGKIDEAGNAVQRPCNANILTLKSGVQSSWKANAKRQIKMAQVIIVVIGEDSCESSKIETMGWEVGLAAKNNKQLMIVNPNGYPLPSYLYRKNHFTGLRQLIAEQNSLAEIKKKIDDFANGRYTIFSPKYDEMDLDEQRNHNNELLDQYKLFQKSSEDLVSRRQSVNSFYISVNSALVALIGIVMGVFDFPTKLYVMVFMCITGIILDISWNNILDAYGTLNAAKMKVIKLIEEQLPVALYDAEWKIMSDKLNNKKYVSFTDSEKRIPRIFAFAYLVILAVIGMFALKQHMGR